MKDGSLAAPPPPPPPHWRWRGLTLQLSLFIILPLTLMLLLVAFGGLSLHHASMRTLVGDRDLRAVRAAAANLSNEVEHRALALQLFAQQLSQPPDPAVLDAAFLPGFERGLVLASNSGQILSGNMAGLPDLANHLPSPAGNVVFSEPVQNETGNWLILAAVPVPGGSRLIGAFSTAELAKEALSGVTTPKTAVMLVSSQEEILYHYGHTPGEEMSFTGVQEALRGESGVSYGSHLNRAFYEYWIPQSAEHLAAYAPVQPLGWALVLEESWQEIASPLLTWSQAAPLVLVPILLLAVFALWFVARSVVQPLQELESRTARLASGDFSAIRSPVGGISEIHHLQGALVNMARDLQAAQESLHGYIGALTAGVENERRALARELHDDTLQSLIAINQQAQFALLQTDDAGQRQQLLSLQSQVNQTILNLRRAIGGLRPIYLEDLGLAAALGMLVKETQGSGTPPAGSDQPARPQAVFHLTGVERRLPPETELAFYRIAQEAIHNAVHHAGAAHITVMLVYGPLEGDLSAGEPHRNHALLSIQDDGAGFQVPSDPSTFARSGHYGLLGMRERADLVGADLEIKSAVSRGTLITAKCIW